jgi:hypothetical protein
MFQKELTDRRAQLERWIARIDDLAFRIADRWRASERGSAA